MSGSIPETLKARGNEFFAKGKLDAAIDAYTEAICLEPTQAAYYTNRALCHFKKQRWHQAASDSASALSLEGGSIKGLYLHGASEAELGNFPTAIADLERAIALCKQTAVSYKVLIPPPFTPPYPPPPYHPEFNPPPPIPLPSPYPVPRTLTYHTPSRTRSPTPLPHP